MIQPGEYRHRVSFREKTRTSDGRGGSTATFTTTTVYGVVESLTGRELQQAQQLSTTLTHRIRTRFRTGIVAGMEALWVNAGVRRTLNVEAVQAADTMNEEIYVLCAELAQA